MTLTSLILKASKCIVKTAQQSRDIDPAGLLSQLKKT